MKTLLLGVVSLGAVLLYLLATASASSGLLAENYTLFVALNGVLVVLLAGLVGRQLWQLLARLRRRVFGARLGLRLMLYLAMMAVLPGVLVYGVSVQFLTRTIDSWFDVRVERALEGGLNLGRTALDNMLRELNANASAAAVQLAEQPWAEPYQVLERLRERTGADEIALFDPRGKIIAFTGGDRASLLPRLPDAQEIRQVRFSRSFSSIDTAAEGGLTLRVLTAVMPLSPTQELRILQLTHPVPPELTRDGEAVQAAYQDYQKLALSRIGLRQLFGVTLTLSLLLSVLSAFGIALILSERMAAPLSRLAEATQAVARGDFSRREPVESHDELGILTESFNSMTRQLAEARESAHRNHEQVERSRAYLESILANLSSGVLALDGANRLRSANTVAGAILGVDMRMLLGIPAEQWGALRAELAPLGEALLNGFESATEWQQELELRPKGRAQTLLLRGSRFPDTVEEGCVIVFDDITELLQAQRLAAWGEVARRLAHEIKNPLTPIQLSAERVQRKLSGKLEGEDADLLERATRNIVTQVAAMKEMVDAFSHYARLPALKLLPLDVNTLVQEVLSLYEGSRPEVEPRLGAALPPVSADREGMRQVIHNLINNAQDALSGAAAPRITLATEIEAGGVRLSVSDNGAGFPREILDRAFEPYVTSKPKGTGLGLAIVKRIVDAHQGVVRIENLERGGARVSVWLPAASAEGRRAA